MSNLTRLAFSSLSSNKRPGFAYSSSYSAAAALCNSRKGPSPPSKQQARAEASASFPRPAEIPWQPKIANSVRLIGLVGMPVHLEAAPDGNYWAATVLVQQKSNDSPRVRIPLLFEGDLAQIAACHLKEKDLICVTGQLSGDPPTLPFENSRAKNQVIVKKTNHVQMLKTQLEVNNELNSYLPGRIVCSFISNFSKLKAQISTTSFSRRYSSSNICTPPPTVSIQPLSYSNLKTQVLSHYKDGKFHNLLYPLIFSPAVLLSACHSLVAGESSLSNSYECQLLAETLAQSLQNHSFDIRDHCVLLYPSRKKGQSLILPDLKLKVVMEAIRLVFEIVYDSRFATFSYGGRATMGCHTAIRYLKTSVENPSWWFPISIQPQKLNCLHVNILASIIEDKIADTSLIKLLKNLFQYEAVNIDLGSLNLGRGFPQESSLCSILLNIYLNELDQEIQTLRLRINQKTLKLDATDYRVSHNPVRVYAVRYMDEILVITSGPKLLALDMKNQLVNYIEQKLALKVDKVKTTVHSATSEKMDFMGMELQAVPPMILHPPMSDKAIRARKKYLKRKKEKAQEIKNARETIRKKLGLKVLTHLFKKMKRSQGFKSELPIEGEIRVIFSTWANEVVAEFLRCKDECWNWHRMLSSGDFLKIGVIREQLPGKLLDAYDDFLLKVEKYMKPEKANCVSEEVREEKEDLQMYDLSIEQEMTKLCIKVTASMASVRKAVKLAGFTNMMGRPRPIKLLIPLEDTDIIKWYAGVGRRWLNFFCCCRNFKMVKTVVNYHLRFSCILTLAEKHGSSKREVIGHYGKDLKVIDTTGEEEVHFPTEREIKMMGDKNLSDPKPVDDVLCLSLVRLACDEPSGQCIAHFCNRTNTVLYRIRLLQNRLNVNPSDLNKWVPGMGAIHESLNRRCLPLCSEHIDKLYLGEISLQDIDCTLSLDVVVKNVGYVKIINRQSPTLASRYQCFTGGKDKKSDPVNMTLWEDLIANPKQWWDCRTAKINGMFDAKHPDFEHKSSGRCLWIRRAPDWVLTKVCELEFEKVKVNPQQ